MIFEKFGRKFVSTKAKDKYFMANGQEPIYIVNFNKVRDKINLFMKQSERYNFVKQSYVGNAEFLKPKQISFESLVSSIYFIKEQSLFDAHELKIATFSDFDNNAVKTFDSKEEAIKSIKKIMCIM